MASQGAEKKRRRQVCVQLSEELKDWLVGEARRNGRSLNKEMELQLEWARRDALRLRLHRLGGGAVEPMGANEDQEK